MFRINSRHEPQRVSVRAESLGTLAPRPNTERHRIQRKALSVSAGTAITLARRLTPSGLRLGLLFGGDAIYSIEHRQDR